MKIKKFVAPSLPEALAKIKQDLGEEAVILKTRFNGGAGKNKNVEVTAAVDPAAVAEAKPAAKERKAVTRISAPAPEKNSRIEIEPQPAPQEPVADPAPNVIQTPSELLADIKRDLGLVKQVINGGLTQSLFGQPTGFQIELARQLVQRGVSEMVAVEAVRGITVDLEKLSDSNQVWAEVKSRLINMLSPGESMKLFETAPTVIMLVGPTGSGKTSTAARLAFHHSIEKGLPATLISTDTFRADSREQLKLLSSVIGCQAVTLTTPEELAVALRSYKKGLIIIDTSGISTAKDIAELIPFIGAANPHEIDLVVPADSSSRDIKKMINSHPDFKFDKLLVTKLDQTRNRGGILSAARECGLKFSYQCASREMPGLFGLFNPESFISSFLNFSDDAKETAGDSLEVIGW
jgi:flagellar biosynthesis protein FlhF